MAKENIGFHRPFPNRKIILASLLITIILLQIAATQIRSFWEDEAYTGWLITRDYVTLIENLKADVNSNPPLYWLTVFFWSKVFGTSEFGLKSFSILCLVVTCILTYKVTKNLFDINVALIAVGLLAFSPLVLTYAHNARYYSMSAALTLLLLLLMDKYIQTNISLYLIFYVLAGTGLLYTLYMGVTVLLALNLWWLLQWLRGNRQFSRLVVWALAQGLILLFYAPWISTLVATMHRNLPSEYGGSNWLLEIALRVGYLGYAYGVGEFLSPLNPVLWVGMIITAGLIFFAFMKGKKNFWLPVIIFVVAGVISIGFNLIALYPQNAWQNLSSRTLFVYPLFVMILAYGIGQVKNKWRWGALVVILIVYGFGIFNYFTDRQAIKPILIVPWREIMTDIQERSNPDSVVICTNADFACFYYQTRYGFEPLSPANLAQLEINKPSEIWWIQSNLGNKGNSTDANVDAIAALQTQYKEPDIFNYAPQDNGVALLKTKFLGYQPYQYRVVVYRFVLP